jgi:hypothetical protein
MAIITGAAAFPSFYCRPGQRSHRHYRVRCRAAYTRADPMPAWHGEIRVALNDPYLAWIEPIAHNYGTRLTVIQ